MTVRPSLDRSALGRRFHALFAALLIVLTLGVGTAEAWHGGEHAEDEPCAECVLCTVTLQGPIADAPVSLDAQRLSYDGAHADRGSPAPHVVAERRNDAPRAPPA